MTAPLSSAGEDNVRYDELDSEFRYRGQRRAGRAYSPPTGRRPPGRARGPWHVWTRDRRWLLVGGVVALSATLAVVLILAAAPIRRNTGIVPNNPGTGPGGAPGAGASAPGGASATQGMGNGHGTARPTAKPTAGRVAPPGKVPTVRPLRPMMYEAEAAGNVLAGSATVSTYFGASGGSIVRNIGAWGSNLGAGTLTFTTVIVPESAVYILTFFYVHLDNEAQRTVVITSDDVNSLTVAVTGSSNCCASKAVLIPLRKGRNTIMFGNPYGHAPSIDRIVVSGF